MDLVKYLDIQEKLKEVKSKLESEGFTVAYICLYGSQSYNLDIFTEDYQSDFDMKAVIVPTLDELILNSKPYSKVHETPYGQVDVKDLRHYLETINKGNPTYVETLHAIYYSIDPLFEDEMRLILSKADALTEALSCQLIRAIYGMSLEKLKALKHPYPTTAAKIEKFGYDPKQLASLLRLRDLAQSYFLEEQSFTSSMWYGEEFARERMIQIKTGSYILEEAEMCSIDWVEEIKNIRNDYLQSVDEQTLDYSAKYDIIGLGNEIIRKRIERDISRE